MRRKAAILFIAIFSLLILGMLFYAVLLGYQQHMIGHESLQQYSYDSQ